MSTMKEKMKAVAGAIAAIEKQFGKGAIMPLDGGEIAEIAVIPTGSVGLDLALGVGGLPRGRVIEIYGPESSGKTTLTLQAIAQAQRAGGVCAFIDAEHALDVGYARKLGVRIEDLLVSQPDHGEQALEIADKLVGTAAIDLIVIDSVAALVPKAEIEGEMGDAHMGLQARLMSQALRKLTAATARNNTAVAFINQLRQKIGVVYGNPETTTAATRSSSTPRCASTSAKIGIVKNGEQRHRHPDARQGREEQGGAAVPRGRVRHPLRHRRQRPGRDRRPRRRARADREVGRVLLVQGRAHRPGPRQRLRLRRRAPGAQPPRCAPCCSPPARPRTRRWAHPLRCRPPERADAPRAVRRGAGRTPSLPGSVIPLKKVSVRLLRAETESAHLSEDLFGGPGPLKGLPLLVVSIDVGVIAARSCGTLV